jgi:hypothetical protein
MERVPWLEDARHQYRPLHEGARGRGRAPGHVYAALSRESGTKMGLAPSSVVIYDEFGQTESRDLLDALDTAMGKRHRAADAGYLDASGA